MKKTIISVAILVLLFLGSVETFAQKQIVRRVPNEPVVPQKQAQPTKMPTHHAPKKKGGYDYVAEYSEGLAWVRLNGKYGFIDKSGTEVIPCKYDNAVPFNEGLASVELNGKFGFVDKSGSLVIPCKYDVANSFDNGRSLVFLNGKRGYVNKSGVETWD